MCVAMSPSRVKPADKEAPSAQPAPVGTYGNSGHGASSVLRALLQRRGELTHGLEPGGKYGSEPSRSKASGK